MSFDAGEIIAYLKLDRSQFNRELDKALAEAEAKTKKGIKVKVKPILDEADVAKVLAEEEILRKDIEPEVKPQYSKAEIESIGASIGTDLAQAMNDIRWGPIRVIPPASGELGSGGGAIQSIIYDWLGMDQIGGQAAIGTFMQKELTGPKGIGTTILGELTGPKGIGTTIQKELTAGLGNDMSMGGRAALAGALAAFILPTEEELNTAFEDVAAGRFSGIGGGLGGSRGGGGIGGLPGMVSGLLGGGATYEEIRQQFKDMGIAPGLIDKAIIDSMRGSPADLKSAGGEVAVGNDIGGLISTWLHGGYDSGNGPPGTGSKWLTGPAAPFDNLSASGGGLASLLMSPIGLSAMVPLLGALGLGAGGMLAGTSIGLGGTFAALLPGYLDLTKGMAAYSAISTGASTKGMSGGQLGLGRALMGLVGTGSKGIGGAETQIMPSITKFISAITGAVPLMHAFTAPAINAMTRFFAVIDKGMSSGGFKSFVRTMGKDVGPIMNEFGRVLINLGTAFGGFLKLFGGVAAKVIGPWFVKVTGELSKFLNHVKFGHGFVSGFKTVMGDLGKVLVTLYNAAKDLLPAIAPVGMQIFRIAGWMAMWAGRVVKLIPPWLVTTILSVVIAFKALSIVMGVIDVLAEANPFVLIGTAIVALGVLIFELVKHWKTVWAFIKRITLDAWHFLYQEVFHPIIEYFSKSVIFYLDLFKGAWNVLWHAIETVAKVAWRLLWTDTLKPIIDFFAIGISGALGVFKSLWDTVWGGIVTTVKFVWKLLKPIFDAISTAIGGVISGVKDAVGIVSKVGGFLSDPFGLFSSGSSGPSRNMSKITSSHLLKGSNVTVNVDARGHTNPSAVTNAARLGVHASLPSLQAALARGAA